MDATVVVALVDCGPDGAWAEALLDEQPLAAPHLLPVKVAYMLRRAVVRGAISEDTGSAFRVPGR